MAPRVCAREYESDVRLLAQPALISTANEINRMVILLLMLMLHSPFDN
jgi:hypothetical protein